MPHKGKYLQIAKQFVNNSLILQDPNVPTCFVDFPLVGSEKIYKFPFVLNGHVLNPNELRSSILLNDSKIDKRS